MKKSWFFFAFAAVAAIALLLVHPFSTAQTGDVTVSVSSVSGAPGEEVTVTLSVTENPGLRALSFTLDYDSALLTPVSAAYTDGFGSDYATDIVLDNDPIVFNRIFRSEVTATGAFASVTFRIDGTASAVTPLTLASRGDAGWTLIDGVSSAALTVQSGTVTIQGPAAALSFTLVSRTAADDAVIRLYPASLTDAEIRADLAAGALAADTAPAKSAVLTAEEFFIQSLDLPDDSLSLDFLSGDSSGDFVQTVTLSAGAGEYKLAISKPGKHAPRVLPVSLTGDLDLGEVRLLLYGDANADGAVNAKDALQIARFAAGKSSVFGSTPDAAWESYRLFAAAVVSGGTSPNAQDALQIARFAAGKVSVFSQFA
ncbi:MAG: hypothetical protein IJR89_08610 [Clostridia bacterium]|nr:hypothetical protein [Clostridia bacterium]